MYKEDTLLLEFAPAVEAGLSGLVLFYNSVLVPVGNFAAAYGWPAVKFVVGKGIATPLIGAAAGAYIVGQEGILKLMDYCDSRSNSPEQKAKFKKFARMVRLKAKMVKKYGAANLLRNKVLKRYKINKVVKDNPKVPKEVVGGTTEGSVVMYQERILNEAQIKFLYYMCNHNPNIKQDSLYIEACVRNPKKMNSLIEGTGMDNTRARMLMFLAEAYGIRPIDSKRGKVLNFKRFKEEYKDVLKENSSKISARNLYSLYLLDSASNIYGLTEDAPVAQATVTPTQPQKLGLGRRIWTKAKNKIAGKLPGGVMTGSFIRPDNPAFMQLLARPDGDRAKVKMQNLTRGILQQFQSLGGVYNRNTYENLKSVYGRNPLGLSLVNGLFKDRLSNNTTNQ